MNDQPLFSEQELKSLKIICVLLAGGVTLFALIAILLPSEEPGPGAASASAIGILRLIHLLLTLGAIVFQKVLYERIMAGKMQTRGMVGPTTFAKKYLTASIVRLAIVEGAALFGLVIVLVATTGGHIGNDPTYYLHLIPAILLIMTARAIYPSAGRVAELTREYPQSQA